MIDYKMVVIGTSAGGLAALETILSNLDANIDIPVVIVQHLSADSRDSVLNLLRKFSVIELTEPVDKEHIKKHIYLAPADYHLMIEKDFTFSVSLDPKVNFCRPSIDVLFETAAEVYMDQILGIVLTGANHDGTNGCKIIKKFGGTVIAQDPDEASNPTMPEGVINSGYADYILSLNDVYKMLNETLKRSDND